MLNLLLLGNANVWKVDDRRTYTDLKSERSGAGITIKNTAADNTTMAWDKRAVDFSQHGLNKTRPTYITNIIKQNTRLKFNQKTLKPQIINGSKDKNFDVNIISVTAPKGYALTDFYKERARVYSVGSDYRTFVDFVMSSHNGGYVRVTFKNVITNHVLSYTFSGDENGALYYTPVEGTEEELRMTHPEITTKNFVLRKAQKKQPLTYLYKPSSPSRLILLDDVTEEEVKKAMAATGRCFAPDHYVFGKNDQETCDKYLADGYTAVTIASSTRTPICYGDFAIVQTFVPHAEKIFHYVG